MRRPVREKTNIVVTSIIPRQINISTQTCKSK